MVLSISLLNQLVVIFSVVLSRIGRLLSSFLNCVIVSSVNFCTVLSCFGLGFVWEVSNVMNLSADKYGPAMTDPSYVVGVIYVLGYALGC